MSRQGNTDSGFGYVFVLLGIFVFAVIIVAAGYTYLMAQHVPSRQTNTTSAKSSKTASKQASYLKVPQLGIRIKLTANTRDAYYSLTDSVLAGRPPFVHLAVHSLDAYQGCTPSGGGIAVIGTFVAGQSDPVTGNFATVYPKAPKIGSLYYYVTGNQYDCSDGKATSLYSSAKHDFIDAYTSIQSISR